MLVFPELSLTGYEPELGDELAFTETDERLAPIQDLASECALTLVVGAPVRLESGLHIGAFSVSPDRSAVLYTKQHLGAGEDAHFAAGTRDPLIELGASMAALAVCADANHASHPENAAARGASVYLLSSLISCEEYSQKSVSLRAYAARHSMTVVFANYGGPSGGLDPAGRSAIWSPAGDLLAQLDGVGRGLVIARETDTGWSARALRE